MAAKSSTTKKKPKKVTPLMQQYFSMKSQHPDAILLFRVGDFYETFGEDAIKASKILGIVLTSRNNGGSNIELAGFPYHSMNLYMPKLVRAGYRVAICEQLEKPSKEKKIVARGVTDIVTPGVTLDESILNQKANNFVAAIHFTSKGDIGVAFLDISTGDFMVSEGNRETIVKLVESFQPSEILHSKSYSKKLEEIFGDGFYSFPMDEWVFTPDFTKEKLVDAFDVKNFKGFGIEELELGQIAAGVILHYLSTTHNDKLKHINNIQRIQSDHFVWLDRFTIRNLELIYSNHDTGKSLLEVIDQTATPMGARLMRNWILMPLLNVGRINERHDAVSYFLSENSKLLEYNDIVKRIGDLERIISKVAMERINPRELVQLRHALELIEEIQQLMLEADEPYLNRLGDKVNLCESVRDRISAAIQDEPPTLLSKGNVIKDGLDAELDDIRDIIRNSKQRLLELQQAEAERTGITNLKIGFNNVFGYYLEVTNKYKNQGLIPDNWVRKQTLTNAERYITDDLKVLEDKILNAEEQVSGIEDRLYNELVTYILDFVQIIQVNAKIIAQLDCLLSFAKAASKFNYARPTITNGHELEIKSGRHPVIEQQLPLDQQYVANDMLLDNKDLQIMMITGPNMSGKSAVLRQTALITLMAQIGSFVPAESASIGLVDKIFTRVGASDNISSGESTFMLEMNETASIMNNISERSLILLDEIGRGTSTYDGISIAWSLAEYLHNNNKANPKTLFATHYHELNELANKYDRIKNYNVAVKEVGNKVLFLRKLVEGGSQHSFGIHVAAMAGMPKDIVKRATEILVELEKKSITNDANGSPQTEDLSAKVGNIATQAYQLSIFETVDETAGKLKEAIQSVELNTMTPIECMMKLNELKKLIED